MTSLVVARSSAWLGLALLCSAVGLALGVSEQAGFALAVVLIALAAVTAPAAYWAIAALVSALTFRGAVTLGLLPSVATFVDIPFAWGALAVALLRFKGSPAGAAGYLRWLAALAGAVALSSAFHPAEAIRPLLYLALLGEPFALIGALVLDPPGPRLHQTLSRVVLALLVVQVPLAVSQAATTGIGDDVKGTLHGAGAGHHVIGAVAAVGAIWLLANPARRGRSLRFALVPLLLAIPFLADAKQVIFAMPVMLLAGGWRLGRVSFLGRTTVGIGSLAALLLLFPSGQIAVDYVENTLSREGGKEATAELVWHEVTTDPESLFFGKGPAQTVSRSAFMTTDLLLREDSPLRALELRPARIALEAETRASSVSGGRTSFDRGQSSALGVLGDLGLAGAVVYLGLVTSIVLALRRRGSPEASALAGAWIMFALLGLVFDWWEQPPLSVFLGVLSGLALTRGPQDRVSPGEVRR